MKTFVYLSMRVKFANMYIYIYVSEYFLLLNSTFFKFTIISTISRLLLKIDKTAFIVIFFTNINLCVLSGEKIHYIKNKIT